MSDTAEPPGDGRCGAVRKGRPPCKHPAGYGTDHVGIGRCKFHAGSTPSHVRSAQLVLQRQACESLGIPVEIEPGEALMRALWRAQGNVTFYEALVRQLATHPGELTVGPEGELLDAGALYAPTFHESGKPTGEAKPHVLLMLYHEAERWLATVAEKCLRAGVEERRVRLAERDAAQLLGAQVKALQAMGLGDRLEDFRRAFLEALDDEPAHFGASPTG